MSQVLEPAELEGAHLNRENAAMRRQFPKIFTVFAALGLMVALAPMSALAASLMERANNGETIRIGFANEVPWAYPGDNNEPKGFVNAIALGILGKMGITDIEPVVTDWGGLIPGLKADRYDIITGGMYILKSRTRSACSAMPSSSRPAIRRGWKTTRTSRKRER
jgi:hypothetical protein